MTHYLLGLGSNLNPERHLPLARAALADIADVITASPPLKTSAVGTTFSQPFQNQLILVRSGLDVGQLKQQLLQIEESLGREPKCEARKKKDRTIDIDILGEAPEQQTCLRQPLDESYYQSVREHWQQALRSTPVPLPESISEPVSEPVSEPEQTDSDHPEKV